MKGKQVRMLVVQRASSSAPPTTAVRPGVEAVDPRELSRRLLSASPPRRTRGEGSIGQ